MSKSSKSTSTTGPSAQALPYLQQASGALTNAYNSNAGNVSNITNTLNSLIPSVVNSTTSNPTLSAANSYDQSVLSGQYLGANNPYLNQQIADTDKSVTDAVNAGIGTRGLTGGSAQTQLLANQLAQNETNLRYNDYNTERQNMNTAASNASSLSNANDNNISTLLSYLGGTATLPGSVASQYASGLGSLWGNSTTTNSTQSQGLGTTLGGILGAGLSGWASGGFKT